MQSATPPRYSNCSSFSTLSVPAVNSAHIGNVQTARLNNLMETSPDVPETLRVMLTSVIDDNQITIIGDHSHRSELVPCILALIEDRLLQNPNERIAICPEGLIAGVSIEQNFSDESKLYRQLAIKHPQLEFYGLETSVCTARQNRIDLISKYAEKAITQNDMKSLSKASKEIFGYIEESRNGCPNQFHSDINRCHLQSGLQNADEILQLLTVSDEKIAWKNLMRLINVASIYSGHLYTSVEANRLDTNGDFSKAIPIHDSGISKFIVIAGENHCYETGQSQGIQQHLENSPAGKGKSVNTILFNGGSQFVYGKILDPTLPVINSVTEHLTFPGQLVMDTLNGSAKMQEYDAMLARDEVTPGPIFHFVNEQQGTLVKQYGCSLL